MINIPYQAGLTLLELMVVLTIIVILTAMAVPTFSSLIQKYRIISVAESLYNSLQYARSEAIKQNTTVYVSFQTGDSWCYGINTGSACNCNIANNCNLGTTSAAAAGQITFSVTGYAGNTIQFENTHGAANASGTITLTLYGQTNLITLNVGRLGNVQFCSTGISGFTSC